MEKFIKEHSKGQFFIYLRRVEASKERGRQVLLAKEILLREPRLGLWTARTLQRERGRILFTLPLSTEVPSLPSSHYLELLAQVKEVEEDLTGNTLSLYVHLEKVKLKREKLRKLECTIYSWEEPIQAYQILEELKRKNIQVVGELVLEKFPLTTSSPKVQISVLTSSRFNNIPKGMTELYYYLPSLKKKVRCLSLKYSSPRGGIRIPDPKKILYRYPRLPFPAVFYARIRDFDSKHIFLEDFQWRLLSLRSWVRHLRTKTPHLYLVLLLVSLTHKIYEVRPYLDEREVVDFLPKSPKPHLRAWAALVLIALAGKRSNIEKQDPIFVKYREPLVQALKTGLSLKGRYELQVICARKIIELATLEELSSLFIRGFQKGLGPGSSSHFSSLREKVKKLWGWCKEAFPPEILEKAWLVYWEHPYLDYAEAPSDWMPFELLCKELPRSVLLKSQKGVLKAFGAEKKSWNCQVCKPCLASHSQLLREIHP